jgi:hypothetical protein
MSHIPSFKCTCRNQAKNLLTTNAGALIARCGRCSRIGKPGVTTLSHTAFTPEIIAKITQDTRSLVHEKYEMKREKETLLSKFGQIVAANAPTEQRQERPISHQIINNAELLQPLYALTKSQKWNQIPYGSLLLVFEFLGEWGVNRVSKRWYDAFMNHDFKLIISSIKLVQTMSRCIRSIKIIEPGWNEDHTTFWRKQTSCHNGTISLLTILPSLKIPSHIQRHAHLETQRDWYRRRFDEWILSNVIKPLFAIRDRSLFNNLCTHFEEQDRIRSIMKSEFRHIAIAFMDSRRFPLFLREYGYLLEEFNLDQKMIAEIASFTQDRE